MTATVAAPANVARARQLLHSAAEASKQLEENVRELVTMRAWDVLGYATFSEMWEKENGFGCPTIAKVLAADVLRAEGLSTRTGSAKAKYGSDGHTQVDIAKMVGFPTQPVTRGYEGSPTVSGVLQQLDAGVPASKVIAATGAQARRVIENYGTRKRPTPKRIGAAPTELVTEGFSLPKHLADEVYEISRKADIPKSEIYRQAVAEYLARYRASRPGAES